MSYGELPLGTQSLELNVAPSTLARSRNGFMSIPLDSAIMRNWNLFAAAASETRRDVESSCWGVLEVRRVWRTPFASNSSFRVMPMLSK